MDAGVYRRRSWVACPKCGHKVAKVQICDMEVKCPQCSYLFEVVIGPSSEKVQDSVEK
jgi:phage FluMu protein Com